MPPGCLVSVRLWYKKKEEEKENDNVHPLYPATHTTHCWSCFSCTYLPLLRCHHRNLLRMVLFVAKLSVIRHRVSNPHNKLDSATTAVQVPVHYASMDHRRRYQTKKLRIPIFPFQLVEPWLMDWFLLDHWKAIDAKPHKSVRGCFVVVPFPTTILACCVPIMKTIEYPYNTTMFSRVFLPLRTFQEHDRMAS